MKISRQFAEILIKLLDNQPVAYDRETAISQLKNAIDLDILYARTKLESRSISQFRGNPMRITQVKQLSDKYINSES